MSALTLNRLTWLEPWYLALQATSGIVLEVNNVKNAIAKLYAIRKAQDDPSLSSLSICLSPLNPNQIWIYKQDARPTAAHPPSV